MEIIAKIQTDFPTKFGIPRQSGLVESLKGVITFEPKYRNPQGVYGLDGYSYIWLLWSFSENHREGWSATVKPPRLGGNKRMGVFATRSPFRPNDIGLSCVKLERVVLDEKNGPMLYVAGVDLMDQTPIYDIMILSVSGFGENKSEEKLLRILIPESLNYKDTFKDIFDKYLDYYEMKNVKTTNMGSMFELQYLVTAKKDMDEKAFIDEIRCRNGNLNISLGMMPDKHDTML